MKTIDLKEQLIKDCIRGDRKAQFRLYHTYAKAMYNICVRMVKERDAEDLLQSSFIDVFNHLSSFNYQSTPGAWIKRIVINNCINHIRKKKLNIVSMDDQVTTMVDEEETTPKNLNVRPILEAIDKLPDGYRVVFNLYAMEGYDHVEIAQVMDISVATSKSQYHRAKKKLKDLLSCKEMN